MECAGSMLPSGRLRRCDAKNALAVPSSIIVRCVLFKSRSSMTR
jgi:hypothetical protein